MLLEAEVLCLHASVVCRVIAYIRINAASGESSLEDRQDYILSLFISF